MNKEIWMTQYQTHGDKTYFANIFDTKENRLIMDVIETLENTIVQLKDNLEVERGSRSSNTRAKKEVDKSVKTEIIPKIKPPIKGDPKLSREVPIP